MASIWTSHPFLLPLHIFICAPDNLIFRWMPTTTAIMPAALPPDQILIPTICFISNTTSLQGPPPKIVDLWLFVPLTSGRLITWPCSVPHSWASVTASQDSNYQLPLWSRPITHDQTIFPKEPEGNMQWTCVISIREPNTFWFLQHLM